MWGVDHRVFLGHHQFGVPVRQLSVCASRLFGKRDLCRDTTAAVTGTQIPLLLTSYLTVVFFLQLVIIHYY